MASDFRIGAVEGKLRALQHDGGMLQPGDDALGRGRRLPGDARDAAAMGRDPVGHQRARIGGRELGAGRAHVAQPAEAVQRLQPAAVLHLDLEWRAAAGLDQMAGQREAAVVDFQRDLRVGEAQIRRRDQHALRRAAGIAPAIDRAGAQAPARLAPNLLGDERPETRRAARRSRQKTLSRPAAPLRPPQPQTRPKIV